MMLKLLQDAGSLLFGERWQSELGRALDVSDRSVRRWIADDSVPDEYAPKIGRLIDKRISALQRMRARFP